MKHLILLILFMSYGKEFTKIKFSRNPSQENQKEIKIKNLNYRLLNQIVTCYNSSKKSSHAFDYFYACSKNYFSTNLKFDKIKQMTFFLNLTEEISPFRNCSQNELELSTEPEKTICTDLIMTDGEKKVAFFTLETSNIISNIRLF